MHSKTKGPRFEAVAQTPPLAGFVVSGARGGEVAGDGRAAGSGGDRDAAAPRGRTPARERRPATFVLLIPDEPRKGGADSTLATAVPLLERAAEGPVEGNAAIRSALQDPGFDEVIISTLPRLVSESLRRDLPGRVQTLGCP
jgi:hypothetical protein